MHEHKWSNDPTKVYSCINCGIDFDASRSKEISTQVVRCVKCGEGLLAFFLNVGKPWVLPSSHGRK